MSKQSLDKLIASKTTYTTEDGLLNDRVFDVFEDRDGFIWILTINGISRFDGTFFKNILRSTDPKDIYLNYCSQAQYDSLNHGIWILNTNGLFYHNIEEETTVKQVLLDPITNEEFFVINSFYIEDDIIWFAADHVGMYSYNLINKATSFHPIPANNWQFTPIPQSFNNIIKDPLDSELLWISTNACLMSFNINTKIFKNYLNLEHNVYELKNNAFHKIYFYKDKLFGLTYGYGAIEFNSKTNVFSLINLNGNKRFMTYGSSIINNKHYISTNSGLFVIDYKEDKIIHNKEINTILFKDSRGVYWGTKDEKKFTKYDFLEQSLQFFNLPKDPLHNELNIIPRGFYLFENNFFIPTLFGAGMYRFDFVKKKIWPIEIPKYDIERHQVVQAADFISSFELIYTNQNKLFTLNLETLKAKIYPYQFPSYITNVRDIIVHQNELWSGGRQGGLNKLNLSTGESKSFIKQLLVNKTKSVGWIEQLYLEDNKRIWISRGDEKMYSFIDFSSDSIWNAKDHVHSARISKSNNFTKDSNGRIWISSQFGIGTIKSNNEIDIVDSTYNGYLFKYKNSILSVGNRKINVFDINTRKKQIIYPIYGKINEPIVGPIERLNDSTVIIGCYNGFIIFQPDKFTPHQESPTPYIRSLKANGLDFKNNVGFIKNKQVDLSMGTDFVSFTLGVKAFRLPRIELKYKLNDAPWKNHSLSKEINISNLKHGKLLLQFAVKNVTQKDQPWIYKNFTLYVKPYWYQTFLAKILLIIFTIWILLMFYKWRINAIKKAERFKSRISKLQIKALQSQMNPHFIFNCLNTVDSFIATNNQQKASEYLGRFSKLIRLALENSRGDLVALDRELMLIRNYIELEKERVETPFEYIESIDIIEGVKIPPFLIQPFVENAIWHGLNNKSEPILTIIQKRVKERITITIKDNGIGFMNSQSKKNYISLGTKITKERIHVLNKNYPLNLKVEIKNASLYTKHTTGTIVELSFDLLK